MFSEYVSKKNILFYVLTSKLQSLKNWKTIALFFIYTGPEDNPKKNWNYV